MPGKKITKKGIKKIKKSCIIEKGGKKRKIFSKGERRQSKKSKKKQKKVLYESKAKRKQRNLFSNTRKNHSDISSVTKKIQRKFLSTAKKKTKNISSLSKKIPADVLSINKSNIKKSKEYHDNGKKIHNVGIISKIKFNDFNTKENLSQEFPARKIPKCKFLSPSLECMLGGIGTLSCFDPRIHEKCEIKQKKLLNISYPIKKYKTNSSN